MTIGEKLLTSVCVHKDSHIFMKVQEKLLMGAEELNLYKFIKEYHIESGEFPPLSVLKDHFGKRYRKEKGTTKFYYDECKRAYTQFVVSEALPKISELLTEDAVKAVTEIRSLGSLATYEESESKDTHYGKGAGKRGDSYDKRKFSKGIMYVSTGHPILDELLHGWQETDLVTFGGRSGLGKTWWILWMAILLDKEVTNLLDNDVPTPYGRETILVVSNEISEEELMERMDCLNCELNYTQFLSGALPTRKERKYKKFLKNLEENPEETNLIILYNVSTLHELEMKIKTYNPLITFVDGSYLLEPQMEEGYAKTVFITRNLKNIVKKSRSPIVNTTQLRKGKGTLKSPTAYDAQDDFYHGSYIQDSDVAIKGWQNPDLIVRSVVALAFVKGRRLPKGTALHWGMNMYDTTYSYDHPDDEEEEEFEATTTKW